jgi:hypothetical protein
LAVALSVTQIPIIIDARHLSEIAILFHALHNCEHVDETIAEIVPQQFGAMETIYRREPIAWWLVITRTITVIAIADNRWAGINLVRDPMMHPRQYTRDRKIGVGISTAGAVFDMAA